MKKPEKPNYTIRLDKELREQVEAAGLSIPQLVEHALLRAVHQKQCPVCGTKLPAKK